MTNSIFAFSTVLNLLPSDYFKSLFPLSTFHNIISCSLLGGIGGGNSDEVFSLVSYANRKDLRMEQNDMECQTQTPQGPVLCVNNCGFFGTAATMNMCSKCYKDFVLKQEQDRLAVSSFDSIVNGSTSSEDIVVALETKAVSPEVPVVSSQTSSESSAIEGIEQVKEGPKRCGTCRKRVGLTGFNCRCGSMFCSTHRYSDKHDCPFDYRAAGQEAIAKANPVVKAEKLDKI